MSPIATELTAEVLAEIGASPVIGFDTEFYGLDIKKVSTPHRSKLHVISLAWPDPSWELDPGGYPVIKSGVFLPSDLAALEHILESPFIVKVAHNLPVDQHTLANSGIELEGAVNTLSWVRWLHPEWDSKAGGPGFSLDAIGKLLLGQGKSCSYSELVSYEKKQLTFKKMKVCECQKPKCRQSGSLHAKEELEVVSKVKLIKAQVPLEEILPGHPRWETLVPYAALDAVLALRLFYHLTFEGLKKSARRSGT